MIANHIHDALAQVTAQKFELALIDLGLPDGSGVDVVTALRESQPEALSVIVTIHDDDEHLFPALQAGAYGYILKEQARELIIEQLHRISQGEPPLSPSIARRVMAYFSAKAKPAASTNAMPKLGSSSRISFLSSAFMGGFGKGLRWKLSRSVWTAAVDRRFSSLRNV